MVSKKGKNSGTGKDKSRWQKYKDLSDVLLFDEILEACFNNDLENIDNIIDITLGKIHNLNSKSYPDKTKYTKCSDYGSRGDAVDDIFDFINNNCDLLRLHLGIVGDDDHLNDGVDDFEMFN